MYDKFRNCISSNFVGIVAYFLHMLEEGLVFKSRHFSFVDFPYLGLL